MLHPLLPLPVGFAHDASFLPRKATLQAVVDDDTCKNRIKNWEMGQFPHTQSPDIDGLVDGKHLIHDGVAKLRRMVVVYVFQVLHRYIFLPSEAEVRHFDLCMMLGFSEYETRLTRS